MHTACTRCGMPHAASTPCLKLALPPRAAEGLQAGMLLVGRYRIEGTIHGGGMSVVYLAEDTRQGRRVALKELRLPVDATDEDLREAEAWFARESYLLSTLRHPLIPAFYSVFREDGRSYIVQEYVEGVDLDRLIDREGPQSEDRVLAWGQSLCTLLTYLHTLPEPVVFRDLKPANVLLRRVDGRLAVVDFGIARTCVPGQVHTVVGTPGYAPPEQYQGLATPQSDIYALGATLHRLLTGYDPEQATAFTFPAVRTLNPRVSPHLEAVVMRSLRLAPSERFATAAAFGAALRDIPVPGSQRLGVVPRPAALQHLAVVLGLVLFLPFCAIWAQRPVDPVLPAGLGALGFQSFLSNTAMTVPISYRRQCRLHPRRQIGDTNLVVRGPGRTLWFVEDGADVIGRIGMDGRIDECVLSDSGAGPSSMVAARDGSLWIVQPDSGTILRMTPDGGLYPYGVDGQADLGVIAEGVDGNMWFTLGSGRAIGRITPTGTITFFPLPNAGIPDGLVSGLDGRLWFPEYGSNLIGRIDAQGRIDHLPAVSAIGAGAGGIIAAPDGAFWFTAGNQILRRAAAGDVTAFSTPDDRENVADITTGPDGNLWFVDSALGYIGRITPQGQITQFQLSDLGASPSSIIAGPDGNLWFSESQGQAVGRITPRGRITEFTAATNCQLGSSVVPQADRACGCPWRNRLPLGRRSFDRALNAVQIRRPQRHSQQLA